MRCLCLLTTGLCVLASMGATVVAAQETTPAAARAELLPENAEGEPELGAIQRASYLIGCEVADSKQQSIGRLTDIAIDLEAGRVVALIVRSSHDTQADLVAIPARLARPGVMLIAADLARTSLDKAPKLPHDKQSKHLTRAWAAELYQAFGQPSLWKESDRLDYRLTMLSTLFEVVVSNQAGKQLGRIEDAAIVLDKGLVGYLALSMHGQSAEKNKLYPVPLSAFVVEPNSGKWVLELPQGILADTPSFDANHWPEKIDRGWVEYVHVRYGRSPFAGVRHAAHQSDR